MPWLAQAVASMVLIYFPHDSVTVEVLYREHRAQLWTSSLLERAEPYVFSYSPSWQIFSGSTHWNLSPIVYHGCSSFHCLQRWTAAFYSPAWHQWLKKGCVCLLGLSLKAINVYNWLILFYLLLSYDIAMNIEQCFLSRRKAPIDCIIWLSSRHRPKGWIKFWKHYSNSHFSYYNMLSTSWKAVCRPGCILYSNTRHICSCWQTCGVA